MTSMIVVLVIQYPSQLENRMVTLTKCNYIGIHRISCSYIFSIFNINSIRFNYNIREYQSLSTK